MMNGRDRSVFDRRNLRNIYRPAPRDCRFLEGFNDWRGRGYDDFVPGEVTKKPLPGIGLHDLLHRRQACPEFIAFDQGVGQIRPR